jgi:hypothetical protein
VLFDEFEKTYREPEHQESLLTLLDGVYPSKKLFVLTSNDKYRIDQHMRNRPGRIYYMFEYGGLDPEFIREYCDDNLVNKSFTDSVIQFASTFSKFNFDSLKAMVEEMNRYNESAADVSRLLNVKPTFEENRQYNIDRLNINGMDIPVRNFDRRIVSVNPMVGTARFETVLDPSKVNATDPYLSLENEEGDEWVTIFLRPAEIVQLTKSGNVKYAYKEDDREIVVDISPNRAVEYDYTKLF